METYRPTELKIGSRNCPAAVTFYKNHHPYDRSVFPAGTAAHAAFQAIGEETDKRGEALSPDECREIGMAACEVLISKGRSFDGVPEPPLPADDVWRGLEIALKHIEVVPVEPGFARELGLAVGADWKPVPYGSPRARLRLIADVVGVGEEYTEESFARFVLVRDYKSAWSTDADELDTSQLKAQAVLAWIHALEDGGGVPEILRQQVVNLRTHKAYTRDLFPADPEGAAVLKLWQRQLEAEMAALDSMTRDGRRPARPGGGCMGCLFLGSCVDAQDYLERAETLQTTAERARGYMVAMAEAKRLKGLLQKETEIDPVEVDGFEVGTLPQERTTLADGAVQALAGHWTDHRGGVDGFAELAGLTPSAAKRILRQVYDDSPEVVAAILEQLTTKETQRRFQFRRKT